MNPSPNETMLFILAIPLCVLASVFIWHGVPQGVAIFLIAVIIVTMVLWFVRLAKVPEELVLKDEDKVDD